MGDYGLVWTQLGHWYRVKNDFDQVLYPYFKALTRMNISNI